MTSTAIARSTVYSSGPRCFLGGAGCRRRHTLRLVSFPSPPWKLRGQLWLSLFAVRSSGTTDRPPGVYGAGFVDYEKGGVLAYQELFVARLVRDGVVPRVTVTDMWVSSETSLAGGRSLWAMPKEIADLRVQERRAGPLARSEWSSTAGGRLTAGAVFTSLPVASPRTPFAFTTAQQRDDGSVVVARVNGTARTLPCLSAWRFDADGALAWLRGRRPFSSLRMSDFRLTFGG
jgi:hypothetical protein